MNSQDIVSFPIYQISTVCFLSNNLFLEPYCQQVSMNFRCRISYYTVTDLPFFLGGGLISHANLLLVFSCPSLVKISATFFGQVWRMLFWSSMRKLVAPKLLGGQCDSQKDLRVRNVCCLKLIDEVSMSSKLKTGYYHRFVFSFQQKYRAFHDLFGHART